MAMRVWSRPGRRALRWHQIEARRATRAKYRPSWPRRVLALALLVLALYEAAGSCRAAQVDGSSTGSATTAASAARQPSENGNQQANEPTGGGQQENNDNNNNNQTTAQETHAAILGGEASMKLPLYMRILATIACLLILTVGVAGNLLVPLVVIKTKYLRNSTNLFLINLSVADLLVLTVCMPTVLIELHSRPETWLLGEPMCKLSNYVEMLAANGSIFTILAISFERYYAICKPLKAGYKCTRLRATIIICLIWLLASLLTSPILIMAKSSETLYIDGSLVYNCILETDTYWHKMYVFVSMFAFFCLPLLVLMFVYCLIGHRLIRENLAMSSSTVTGTVSTVANGVGNQSSGRGSDVANGWAQGKTDTLHHLTSGSLVAGLYKRTQGRLSRASLKSISTFFASLHPAHQRCQEQQPEKEPQEQSAACDNGHHYHCNQSRPPAQLGGCHSNALNRQVNGNLDSVRSHKKLASEALSLDQRFTTSCSSGSASSSIGGSRGSSRGSSSASEEEDATESGHLEASKGRQLATCRLTGQQFSPLLQRQQTAQIASSEPASWPIKSWLANQFVHQLLLRLNLGDKTNSTEAGQGERAHTVGGAAEAATKLSGNGNANGRLCRPSSEPEHLKCYNVASFTVPPAREAHERMDSICELHCASQQEQEQQPQANATSRPSSSGLDEQAASEAPFLPGELRAGKRKKRCTAGGYGLCSVVQSACDTRGNAAATTCTNGHGTPERAKALAQQQQQAAATKLTTAAAASSSSVAPLARAFGKVVACRANNKDLRACQLKSGSSGGGGRCSFKFKWAKRFSVSSSSASTHTNSTTLGGHGTECSLMGSGSCAESQARAQAQALAAANLGGCNLNVGNTAPAAATAGANDTGTSSVAHSSCGSTAAYYDAEPPTRPSSPSLRPIINCSSRTRASTPTDERVDSGFRGDGGASSGSIGDAQAENTLRLVRRKKFAHFDVRDSLEQEKEANKEVERKHQRDQQSQKHHEHGVEAKVGATTNSLNESGQRGGLMATTPQAPGSVPSLLRPISCNSSECGSISSPYSSSKSPSPDPLLDHHHHHLPGQPVTFLCRAPSKGRARLHGDDSSGSHLQSSIGQRQWLVGGRLGQAGETGKCQTATCNANSSQVMMMVRAECKQHSSLASYDEDYGGEEVDTDLIVEVNGDDFVFKSDETLARIRAKPPASSPGAATPTSLAMTNNCDKQVVVDNQISGTITTTTLQVAGDDDAANLNATNSDDANITLKATAPQSGPPAVTVSNNNGGENMAISTANELSPNMEFTRDSVSKFPPKRLQSLGSLEDTRIRDQQNQRHSCLLTRQSAKRTNRGNTSRPFLWSHLKNNKAQLTELLVVQDLSKKQQMDSRRQVVIMLGFVVACFFLLFFPYRVFTIWLILSTDDQVQSLGMETYYNLTYFSRILIYLHSAINPIAYNLISTKFRRAFMSILLCRGSSTRRHFTTEHRIINQRSTTNNDHRKSLRHPNQ